MNTAAAPILSLSRPIHTVTYGHGGQEYEWALVNFASKTVTHFVTKQGGGQHSLTR